MFEFLNMNVFINKITQPILKMEKVRFETLEKTVLSRQKKTHVTGNILIYTSKKFNFKFVVKQT